MSELNKRKVRLFIDAVCNDGRLELIDDLLAADYAGYFPCIRGGALGRDGMRGLISSRRQANRGLYIRIEDQVAEEDRVVTRWQASSGATDNSGDACPPFCSGISIVRLLAGKQVDSYTELTSLVRQGSAA